MGATDVLPSEPPQWARSQKVRKQSLPSRILGLATLLMVPGFMLVTSIPALAVGNTAFGEDTEALLSTPIAKIDTQSVASTSSVSIAVARGSFGADTPEQLVAKRAAAIRAAARAGSYSVVGPRQAGDDYPWRSSGGGLSPLGYVTRQCTDFVAWRLNRDAGYTSAPFKLVWANMTPSGGSASAWARAWNANGWQTSNTPVTGAVAWFSGNHVAYVKSVNGDGTVSLEEYNWNGSASYHTRTIAASSVALFLYPPP
jgi:surface antigen